MKNKGNIKLWKKVNQRLTWDNSWSHTPDSAHPDITILKDEFLKKTVQKRTNKENDKHEDAHSLTHNTTTHTQCLYQILKS